MSTFVKSATIHTPPPLLYFLGLLSIFNPSTSNSLSTSFWNFLLFACSQDSEQSASVIDLIFMSSAKFLNFGAIDLQFGAEKVGSSEPISSLLSLLTVWREVGIVAGRFWCCSYHTGGEQSPWCVVTPVTTLICCSQAPSASSLRTEAWLTKLSSGAIL